MLQKMNTKKKGFYRDRAILKSIEIFEVLSTEQIAVLHFNSIKNVEQKLNKTRERMRKLYLNKKVKKQRIDICYPTFYYFKNKQNDLIHDINRNWGLIYLLKIYQEKYRLHNIRTEYVIDDLQADGFLEMVRYINEDDRVFYFVESDRLNSKNKFDKIEKYNNLFISNKYVKEDWIKYTNKFPHILIVSDSDKKKIKIQEIIQIDNIKGLKFEIRIIEDIKNRLLI